MWNDFAVTSRCAADRGSKKGSRRSTSSTPIRMRDLSLDQRLRRRRHIHQENFLLTRRFLPTRGEGREGKAAGDTRLPAAHADLIFRFGRTCNWAVWGKNGVEPAGGLRHTSFRGDWPTADSSGAPYAVFSVILWAPVDDGVDAEKHRRRVAGRSLRNVGYRIEMPKRNE